MYYHARRIANKISTTQNSGWYQKNYEELKLLNSSMPLLICCSDNAMPAITTELNFTTSHLLKYMLQTNKFKDETRVQAAKKMLGHINDPDLKRDYERSRWNFPGFDPMQPFLEEENPTWRKDPKLGADLKRYIEIDDELNDTWKAVGYLRSERRVRQGGECVAHVPTRGSLVCGGE